MRSCFFLIVVVLCFASCKKSELPAQEPFIKIDSISRANLLGEDNIHTPIALAQPLAFLYRYDNQNNFSVRFGGYWNIYFSTGYSSTFITNIYDTVIYSNNTIELVSKTNLSTIAVPPNRRVFTLAGGKMQMSVAYATSSPQRNDTTLYYYQSNQVIDKLVEKYGTYYTVKTFIFNSAGNLQTVSGKTYRTVDNVLLSTTEEKFGNYDTSINPLKKFGIWDETFYRSMSVNNFRSYSNAKRNAASNAITESIAINFDLQYNTQGVVDFTK